MTDNEILFPSLETDCDWYTMVSFGSCVWCDMLCCVVQYLATCIFVLHIDTKCKMHMGGQKYYSSEENVSCTQLYESVYGGSKRVST